MNGWTALYRGTGWLYWITSYLIALVVLVLVKRKGEAPSGLSFLQFAFPREVWRHPSAVLDYKYVALHRAMAVLIYAPLVSGTDHSSCLAKADGADWRGRDGLEINSCGEQLADVWNYVTLNPEVIDHRGMPVPHIVSEFRENDRAMLKAMDKCVKELLQAAGAVELIDYTPLVPVGSAHYMGTCRMGTDPRASVVNEWCRAHDVPNLFVADGSVFVTSASANPTLTIAALAARTADGMAAVFKKGE